MGWKISDLQHATLPLSGSEMLEVTQAGGSRSVRVMDLLPGFEETLSAALADFSDPAKGVGMIGGASRVLRSVAELRGYPKTANQWVMTTGYHEGGSGVGGGFYFLDKNDTTSAENGGTVIVANDGGRWKLNYHGFVFIEQFGARGISGDDTDAIQSAVDFSAATLVPLRAGVGTFGINLNRTAAVEGYALARCGILLKNGVSIYGAGMGRTVFKLLDGETEKITATIPWFNLMTINTVVKNLAIQGITLDINGQNNPISRPGEELPGYTCAGLMVTGSVASVGADARLIDSVIDQVEVKNNPGVTNIGVGSRYGHPGAMGFNVVISRCKFYNSGIDSKDHSSVFCYGDNNLVFGNTFDHPTESNGVRGPVVAVELHGSNNKVIGNTVRNYCQLAWIGAGDEGDRSHVVISGNTATVSWWGVGLYDDPVLHGNLSDIEITGNTIRITGAPISNPNLTGPKYGFYLALGYGATAMRVNVSGNILYCTDRVSNTGVYVGANSGSLIKDAIVSSNIISGFSQGVLVGASSGAVSMLSVKGNKINDCAPTTTIPNETRGISFRDASVFSLHISGNEIGSGDIGAPPKIGIRLTGSATSLFMDGNDTGDSEAGIFDNATISGTRRGRQARTFASLPAQSSWAIGDLVEHATKPLMGTAPNRYIVEGWTRITAGTGNALNTDWVERRVPAGI